MTLKSIKSFSSKILLFGEYLLLCDSKALSIPYSEYTGHFEIIKDKIGNESNNNLKLFADYLQTVNNKLNLNIEKFKDEIKQGLIFKSNIPHSYGLGSSGSLSAAVYDRYANNKINNLNINKTEILKLKNILGLMESFFHGKSSGLDPLISYLGKPVLVEKQQSLKQISLPEFKNKKHNVFLLDYGKSGDTGPLVKSFIERCKDNSFKKLIEKIIPVNNKCIDLFLNGNLAETYSCAKELSLYSLEIFKDMIPFDIKGLWKEGLENNKFYLKLCGSGGGGMILGFTKDFNTTQEILKDYKLKIIF